MTIIRLTNHFPFGILAFSLTILITGTINIINIGNVVMGTSDELIVCLMVMRLNCLPNICVYIYRYDLPSSLVKETSLCIRQWLIQKLVTTLKLRISDSYIRIRVFKWGYLQYFPTAVIQEHYGTGSRKYIKPGG